MICDSRIYGDYLVYVHADEDMIVRRSGLLYLVKCHITGLQRMRRL